MAISSRQVEVHCEERIGVAAADHAAASPVMSLLMPGGAALPPARRLVVLVPDVDLDETGLTRRIWTLAAPRQGGA